MKLPNCRPGENKHTFEQFDGATWTTIDTPEAAFTVTSAGHELLQDGSLTDTLRDYLEDARTGRSTGSDTRQFLAEGGNAVVYAVGDEPLVIKEKKRGSRDNLLPALGRMDRIVHAIEGQCPRWITLPPHYAVVVPRDDPDRQYMLIAKVDSGVTVGDLEGLYSDEPPREPHLAAAATEYFGEVDDELMGYVGNRFKQMKGLVRDALYEQGLVPDSYLTDIDNSYNTLVEPLHTPVAGSRVRLSIIDQ